MCDHDFREVLTIISNPFSEACVSLLKIGEGPLILIAENVTNLQKSSTFAENCNQMFSVRRFFGNVTADYFCILQIWHRVISIWKCAKIVFLQWNFHPLIFKFYQLIYVFLRANQTNKHLKTGTRLVSYI